MSYAVDEEADLTADLEWNWIYDDQDGAGIPGAIAEEDYSRTDVRETTSFSPDAARHRRNAQTGTTLGSERRIVAARQGRFIARLGQAFVLKSDGKEPWVALLHEFIEDEVDGQKQVSFMWLSSPREIRNTAKRRTDFLPNEYYITAMFDENALDTIVGRATIISHKAFLARYPTGKVPNKAREFGKVFVCRRGCNSRTATYTEEFEWEDVYHGAQDLEILKERIEVETKATRKRKAAPVHRHLDSDFVVKDDDHDGCAPETPRKKRKLDAARTPTSKSQAGTPRKFTTPGQRRIITKRPLEFTPLGTRTLSPQQFTSPFHLARTKLHVSAVPAALPCREAEFNQVYGYLESAITAGTGSCMYISGTPGTGKTATVREVIASLSAAVEAEELDDFIFVEINGMKVTDPHQSYSLLWQALTGDRLSPTHALNLLEKEFSSPSPRRVPCVVLMDELDQLVTKTQSVMYNFFNWPGLQHSRLIVLAVANTMDLPERTLSNKISSRLGLTRITFPGYSHEQLIRIIESRLSGVPGNLVDPDAVQFASRKVAQVSGDARRALDICRRAVEIAENEAKLAPPQDENDENEPPDTPSKTPKGITTLYRRQAATKHRDQPANLGRVTIATIQRAIREATTSPLQRHLRALPLASKFFLAAILARARRTGVAESVMGDVIDEATTMATMSTLAAFREFLFNIESKTVPVDNSVETSGPATPLKTRGVAKKHATSRTPRVLGLGAAATDLMEAGVLLVEIGGGNGRRTGERTARVRLNVAEEEIRLALRGDEEVAALGLGD